ncbi:glycosyltransferase family 4 protein [Spelaeicoccus albus]|uniref:Glycosyltransferase involved in cell wall biosynthesis n=1 Tax=Spelaeicoccus albus TaxID=1280376 RepID=A0A7Z0D5C1_9MICO|nr:glycosyltransferase family 4 protein [Spelaeicoccus albus]NYI69088.1 glycosyltransferase involved in cell wall biosynthesis [Spelaeicoccus albus]
MSEDDADEASGAEATSGAEDGVMRILLVLGSSAGGVGTHVKSIAGEFARAGHSVVIAGPEAANEQFGFAEVADYRRLEVPAQLSPADRRSVSELRAIIRDVRPDVVHAHGFRAALVAVLARGTRRPAGPGVVATWHNAVLGGGLRAKVLGLVERFIARRADLTLGASRDLVERALALGAPEARLMPVAAPRRVLDASGGVGGTSGGGGAVDGAGDSADVRGRLRGELGVGDDTTLVLTVGRVAPQKNFGLLIDAAEMLRGTPARFVVAGGADAAELETLERRIDKARLPIEFLGPRTDVGDLYRASDIFLLTSHWEARALVVQEAMAAGLPVVATAVGGVPELIDDAGILVQPGDGAPSGLSDAIRQLRADPARARELGDRARERAAGFPGEAEVAAMLLAVYAEALIR